MKVALFTNRTGFPYGEATVRRIKMIAKALQKEKIEFKLYVLFFNNQKLNKYRKGKIDGIKYFYLNIFSNQIQNIVLKQVFYFIGALNAIIKILYLNKKSTIIYLYSHGSMFNLLLLLFAKFRGLKVVQEINEWSFTKKKKPYRQWILKNPMIRLSDGAIIISNVIKESIDKLKGGRKLKKIVIPILDDKNEYPSIINKNADKFILWLGQVDGYIKDVLFIIEALSKIYKNNKNIRFTIIGRYSNKSLKRIQEHAKKYQFPLSNIILTGYLDDTNLKEYLHNSEVCIVPLWQDQKSTHRFSTKIAQFMFAGKPVITCNIGDMGIYLQHEKNCLFYKVNDAANLAHQIIRLSKDEKLAFQIGTSAKETANKFFHYANYTEKLSKFLHEILNNQ